MPLSGSRTEFLQADTPSDIRYGRSGGWFVSTKKAIGLVIVFIAALVLVGLLVYYLAPSRKENTAESVDTSPVNRSSQDKASNETSEISVSSTTSKSPNVSSTPAPVINLRLPRSVKPHYYTLHLQPFIGQENSNFTFNGRVVIQISCQNKSQNCESITLHAKELDIVWDEVTLTPAVEDDTSSNGTHTKKGPPKKYQGNSTTNDGVSINSTEENVTSVLTIIARSQDTDKDTITIQVEPAMDPRTNYTLQIPFQGNLTDSLRGLYRSSYTDENGAKKWLAITHMEPTSARRVFPCFDEPDMKAQFEIHVARLVNLTAFSNMPINTTEPISDQPGWVWDRFQPSPIMSTYLVAVLVSEFQSLQSNDTTPKFSVIQRKSQEKNAEYALDIGPRLLKYYSEYFGLDYPLPKLDMVALPDFQAGAMENWGLVTYRENRMLVDNMASPTTKQSVASTVAHELAHMWFGNLVTMDWWADLWLNEGFATYVSRIGVNDVEPSWENLDQIIIRDISSGMDVDSLLSTHAIYVPVNTPAQISEVFDPISYSKGSCLIRMLNHSLTEPVFKSGVREYLKTKLYGNANQNDLWAALTAATTNNSVTLPAEVGVKDVMDSWTRQEGFPVVTVTRDYNVGSMTLSQSRFLFVNGTGDVLSQRWYIPVSFTNQEELKVTDTQPRVWLDVKSDKLVENVTKPGSNNWVLVNLQQTGFYRVNYDDTNWRLLAEYLKTAPVESLPTATRAQLIGDAMNLARAGLLNYGKALNLTLYLNRERSYVPWKAFFSGYYYLDTMLKETIAYGNLLRYAEHLLTPVETLLGKTEQPNDTHTQRLLRKSVISLLLDAEIPRYVDYALDLFNQANNATPGAVNPIPIDLRYAVYCTRIRTGTTREWNEMWSRFVKEDDPVERLRMLGSLTCTRSTYLITTLLERSLEANSSIRLQDLRSVWQNLYDKPMATQVAFRYVRQNWQDIYKRFEKTEFVLKTVVGGITSGLTTEVDLKDLLEFKDAHAENFTKMTRTVAINVEKVQLRVLWRQKHEATVTEWLAQHVKSLA